MSGSGPITRWIAELREGDDGAAEQLWAAYFARMVAVAGRKLGQADDGEDVALSAFKSFCLGAQAGRFPQLTDRDNLWPLLLVLTSNKCVDHARKATRLKRGGPNPNILAEVQLIISSEPSPQMLAEVSEKLTQLLKQLDDTGDATLRKIAVAKLQGDSAEEIGETLGVSRRTIERKIRIIEQVWDRLDSSEPVE